MNISLNQPKVFSIFTNLVVSKVTECGLINFKDYQHTVIFLLIWFSLMLLYAKIEISRWCVTIQLMLNSHVT